MCIPLFETLATGYFGVCLARGGRFNIGGRFKPCEKQSCIAVYEIAFFFSEMQTFARPDMLPRLYWPEADGSHPLDPLPLNL